jgi:hypothetical protein
MIVMPRESGASSTPRPLDSITSASGILDHPLSRVMTTGNAVRISINHNSAFPRRETPELYQNLPPKEGVGNAGCQAHPQPRVRWVVGVCTRVFTARSPKSPGIPTQWFTAYSALFPEIGLSCLRRSWSNLHELDASVEASEPHTFAVRFSAVRYRHLKRPPHPAPHP